VSAVAELVVADDLAGAALEVFIRSAPRTVALAGGRTPRQMYERLAAAELGYPWAEVTVVPTDERCVPPDHPDSNLAMIERSLLSPLGPAGPRVIRLDGGGCDADAADREVATALEGRRPALDLAVLGLGEDGHTASLFPGAVPGDDRWVAMVIRPDHPRLTLTLRALTDVGTALFLVAGESKRPALRVLLSGGDVPAARVRAGRVVVAADRAAATGP
jgi:6-phosphogluconolactonase